MSEHLNGAQMMEQPTQEEQDRAALQRRENAAVEKMRGAFGVLHQAVVHQINANRGQVDPSVMQAQIIMNGEHLQLLTHVLSTKEPIDQFVFADMLQARLLAVAQAIVKDANAPKLVLPS